MHFPILNLSIQRNTEGLSEPFWKLLRMLYSQFYITKPPDNAQVDGEHKGDHAIEYTMTTKNQKLTFNKLKCALKVR